MDDLNDSTLHEDTDLVGWVESKVLDWRQHYEANYQQQFDEYYRLWRGQWTAEDRTRNSERSRIIAPALQQAVESSVAEMEEATFAKGRWFDIEDDLIDNENSDAAQLRNLLHQDYERYGIKREIGEVLINAAVYGTGIAEVILDEVKDVAPATQPLEGGLTAVGVNITNRTIVRMKPIMPQNFLIDPVATNVDDALGCIVDEYVSEHSIVQLQESGVYLKGGIKNAVSDVDLEPDKQLTTFSTDKVRLTKYFGLVPSDMFLKIEDASLEDDEVLVSLDQEEEDGEYIEAIIVIANGSLLLKAERNPYMLGDRPIIAFAWDVVPSRFWGRGICEKGYMSQKALDAELRARIDALALTVHPMMAMDATRIPRGTKPEIKPGKMLLTNGNPKEVLHPFNFGQVNQITFGQAEALTRMVQTATGALDSVGMPQAAAQGEGTAAGISMSLGAAMKRHRRTLINFHERFIIPWVKKSACRYMQFDPENYPVGDYTFVARSSMGMIAREYEVTQLVQLLQTTSQESPIYPALVEAIVDNMNLSNREDIITLMKKAQEQSPEVLAASKAQRDAAIKIAEGQGFALQGQAAESLARAAKYEAETKAIPVDTMTSRLKAVTSNLKEGDSDDKEFDRRLAVFDRMEKQDARLSVTPQEAGVRAQMGTAIQQLMEQEDGNTGPVGQDLTGGQPSFPNPNQAFRGLGG